MKKFMKEFTLEGLEDLKDCIENGYTVYVDDLHYELYNTTFAFTNAEEAKEKLLEYDVFKAIDKVVDYEQGSFGEIATDIADATSVANMLVYILGEDFLFNSDMYSIESEFITVEHIDHLIENIDCIE